jgi:hypothetical protein
MGIFQNFVMKQMMKKQLKNLPEKEQKRIMTAVENNPDFFMKIAEEIKEKVNGGMGQTEASLSVMRKYQGELQKIMMP